MISSISLFIFVMYFQLLVVHLSVGRDLEQIQIDVVLTQRIVIERVRVHDFDFQHVLENALVEKLFQALHSLSVSRCIHRSRMELEQTERTSSNSTLCPPALSIAIVRLNLDGSLPKKKLEIPPLSFPSCSDTYGSVYEVSRNLCQHEA